MKTTLHDQLLAGLVALGHKPIAGRSKYTTVADAMRPGRFFFIGPAGALRHGECASKSRSIGCPAHPTAFWKELLERAEKAKEIEV